MAGTEFLLQPPGAAGVQVPQIQPLGKTNGAWASLLAIALIIGLLWAAKTILLPLALGIILAFTLSPLVRLFDRMRLPRFAGVALTMLLALGVVGGIGYVVLSQFSDLSTQITRYTSQMRAKAALTGKSEAATKLESFYGEVLPANLSAARRLFFPWVEQVARNVGLEATSSTVDVSTDRDRQLTQFSIQMRLSGSYAAIREFIHRLERAPRFVVIDRVTLEEEPAENALSLKLELSTFYKGSAQ